MMLRQVFKPGIPTWMALAGIAMGVCAPVGTAPAQSVQFPVQAVGPFDVGLEWLTPKIGVGQPLLFRFHYTLARWGETNKFQVSWDLSHDLVVIVVYPGGRGERLRSVNDSILPMSGIYQLNPGETQWLEKSILYQPEAFSGLIFEQPGTYPVKVVVRCGPQTSEPTVVEFPVINVQVEWPGPKDVPFVKYLETLSIEEGRALVRDLHAGVATPETAGLMEKVLAAAPKTDVAPMALLALAAKAKQDKRPDEAIRRASELVGRYPSHFLADDALMFLYVIYNDRGDLEKARPLLYRLILAYPQSNVIRSHDGAYEKVVLPGLRPASAQVWTLFDPSVAPTQPEWEAMQAAPAAAEGGGAPLPAEPGVEGPPMPPGLPLTGQEPSVPLPE